MTDLIEISENTNRLSKEILDVCFYIHTHLGPGLLESVYEQTAFCLLQRRGLNVEKQKILPIEFDGLVIESGLRLDLLVEDQIIVELKAVESLLPIHEAQVQTYLKLSKKPLGLLVNFNVPSLKSGIKRIAMSRKITKNFA
jgi:GxxExxY protein